MGPIPTLPPNPQPPPTSHHRQTRRPGLNGAQDLILGIDVDQPPNHPARGQARRRPGAGGAVRRAEPRVRGAAKPHRPQQQRFAQRREGALALGGRVHLAEARENTGSAELRSWLIRERALRARHQARDKQPIREGIIERARAGAER